MQRKIKQEEQMKKVKVFIEERAATERTSQNGEWVPVDACLLVWFIHPTWGTHKRTAIPLGISNEEIFNRLKGRKSHFNDCELQIVKTKEEALNP